MSTRLHRRLVRSALGWAALLGPACQCERPSPPPVAAERALADAAPAAPVAAERALADAARVAAERAPADAAPGRAKYVAHRWSYAVSEVSLGIVDLNMGRGLDQVLASTGAELVINGGFFDKQLEPLGLVLVRGKQLSPLVRKLSGGVLWIDGERAGLSASESYQVVPVDFAIQGLPRLVVDARVNIRTTSGPRAARSAICLRNAGSSIEFVIAPESALEPGPTLYELASELAEDGCEAALNLDGGPSTGFAARANGRPELSAPRAGIRHAIVITRRG